MPVLMMIVCICRCGPEATSRPISYSAERPTCSQPSGRGYRWGGADTESRGACPRDSRLRQIGRCALRISEAHSRGADSCPSSAETIGVSGDVLS